MAEVLKKWTEWRRFRRAKYPWDQWLDGRIWKLVAGTDFTCKPNGIIAQAFQTAKLRGKKVRSSTGNGFVVIQAYKPNS